LLRETGRFIRAGERNIGLHPRYEMILDLVTRNPSISTRQIGTRARVPQMRVCETLRQEGYHAFHIQRVQGLLDRDRPQRMEFCRWALDTAHDNPDIFNFVLWTDESTFTRSHGGHSFNIHNTHLWQQENPHAIRETCFQQQFSINVWAALLGPHLIGPFILLRRLTSQLYYEFLDHSLFNLIAEVVNVPR